MDSLSVLENEHLQCIALADTFSNPLINDTTTIPRSSKYYPIYIGPIADSIQLNYHPNSTDFQYSESGYGIHPDSVSIHIFVDTSKTIGSGTPRVYGTPPHPDSDEEWILPPNSRGVFKSYPVFLENIGQDTITIGYMHYIPLRIEAQDSLKVWRPIQSIFDEFCGTGMIYFYLPPQYIALTTCNIQEGAYATKLRVAFGFGKRMYSNVFLGNIDYSQLGEENEYYR